MGHERDDAAAQMRTLAKLLAQSSNLLALLLTATPEEGAEVVRVRLLEQVEQAPNEPGVRTQL